MVKIEEKELEGHRDLPLKFHPAAVRALANVLLAAELWTAGG